MEIDSIDEASGSTPPRTQQIDCNDSLYLYPSYTPRVSLVPQLLTRAENYSEWSRYVKIALLMKNKLGFIDGSYNR